MDFQGGKTKKTIGQTPHSNEITLLLLKLELRDTPLFFSSIIFRPKRLTTTFPPTFSCYILGAVTHNGRRHLVPPPCKKTNSFFVSKVTHNSNLLNCIRYANAHFSSHHPTKKKNSLEGKRQSCTTTLGENFLRGGKVRNI